MNYFRLSIGLIVLMSAAVLAPSAQAQIRNPFNTRVELPVIRFFSIRTAVMVPDGGTIRLGGVSRHSEGAVSSGIPGLIGRPFTNRGIGYTTSSSHANAKVTILSSQEMSEDVLAAARAAKLLESNPNGSAAVRRKADFLSRNIGRNNRK